MKLRPIKDKKYQVNIHLGAIYKIVLLFEMNS